MIFSTLSSFALLAFATNSACIPVEKTELETNAGNSHLETVIQLPKTSWLENIAIRANGEILASRLDKPELYLINPATKKYSLIATFPGVNAAWGITEYKPDVFAVSVGNFSQPTLTSSPGTYSIQTIDLRRGLDGDGRVQPKLLAAIKTAQNLNGLTFRAPDTLYASDSYAGQILSIDTTTGSSRVVSNDPLLKSNSNIPLGVNGLHWSESDRSLYFANTAQTLFGILPQQASGAFGPARKLAENPIGFQGGSIYDDFTFDRNGNVWITTNSGNTINFITRDGKFQNVVVGNKNSSQVAGPTSAAFGRRSSDRNVLYITTTGGLADPINGTYVEGARVLALTT